jgi:hypothetical protein
MSKSKSETLLEFLTHDLFKLATIDVDFMLFCFVYPTNGKLLLQ